MPKNHIKLLDKDELMYFKDKYIVSIPEKYDFICIQSKNYNRKVLHPINKNFELNTNCRKITITSEAMLYWISYLHEYSLIEIQNIINTLYLNKEEINLKNIKKELLK